MSNSKRSPSPPDFLQEDERFIPHNFGKVPSSYEPFFTKELSEIKKFAEVDEDSLSDKNIIANIDDVFWEEKQEADPMNENQKPKKTRSLRFENFIPEKSYKPQQAQNNGTKTQKNLFNTPERNRKSTSREKVHSDKPNLFQYIQLDEFPTEELIRTRDSIAQSKQLINLVIQKQQETLDLSKIRQQSEELEKIVSEERELRTKFFKYYSEGILIKNNSTLTTEQDLKEMINENLTSIQHEVCALISLCKNQNFDSNQTKWNQNQRKPDFTKKDNFFVQNSFRAREKSSKSKDGSKSSNSRQNAKSTEKSMLNDFKTLFSLQSEAKDSMLPFEKMKGKKISFSTRLENALSMGPTDGQQVEKQPQSGLKAHMKKRSAKIAQEKVTDYLENKRFLYKMLSQKQLEEQKNNEKISQEDDSDSSMLSTKLLKNMKPAFFNASHLKYKSNFNHEKVNDLNLLPQNCQLLYLMENQNVSHFTVRTSKQSVKMSFESIQGLKNKKALQNVQEDGECDQNAFANIKNPEIFNSNSRIDRDFSPPKVNRITNSAILPNKNNLNEESDENQEKDIYDDGFLTAQFKSTNRSAKFQNKPNKNMLRSANLMNVAKGHQTSSFVPVIPKKMNKRDIYQEAYEKFKPDNDIDIFEFYERGIQQKCEQYVEEKLNTKKSFKNTFSNIKILKKFHLNQRKLFNTPLQIQTQLNAEEHDIWYEMKQTQIMELLTKPKQQAQNHLLNEANEDEEIKQFLSIGSYKQTNGDSKAKKSSKKESDLKKDTKDKIKNQQNSSDLTQYLSFYEKDQGKFTQFAEQHFKSHNFESKDIVDFTKIRIDEKEKDLDQKRQNNLNLKNLKNKLSRHPQSPREWQKNLPLKKAISEEENEDQDNEEEKKTQSEEKLPAFVVPVEEPKQIDKKSEQNRNIFKNRQQTEGKNVNQTPKTLPTDNKPETKPVQQKPAEQKALETPTQQKPPQPAEQNTANQANSPPKTPERPLVAKVQQPPAPVFAPKTEEKKQPIQQTKTVESNNIFERNKYKPGANLFQQQNTQQKAVFGQAGNIFSRNSPQQAGQPSTNQLIPQQFESFNPHQMQDAFKNQQNLKTFGNFQSSQENNPVNQQIGQQLGQQFSMPTFGSFGPQAFGSGGPNNFGSGIFNANPSQQPPMFPPSNNMNPFAIIQQANIFGGGMPPPPPPPPQSSDSNLFKPRK